MGGRGGGGWRGGGDDRDEEDDKDDEEGAEDCHFKRSFTRASWEKGEEEMEAVEMPLSRNSFRSFVTVSRTSSLSGMSFGRMVAVVVVAGGADAEEGEEE